VTAVDLGGGDCGGVARGGGGRLSHRVGRPVSAR